MRVVQPSLLLPASYRDRNFRPQSVLVGATSVAVVAASKTARLKEDESLHINLGGTVRAALGTITHAPATASSEAFYF
jgi:hypothetical protein